MKTVTRLGMFEDLLAEKSQEIQSIAHRLREVIVTVHPDCIEPCCIHGGFNQ
jgi:hypothetical protein